MKEAKQKVAAADEAIKSAKKGSAEYKKQNKILRDNKKIIQDIAKLNDKNAKTSKERSDRTQEINKRYQQMNKREAKSVDLYKDITSIAHSYERKMRLVHGLQEGIDKDGKSLSKHYGVSGRKLAEVGGHMEDVVNQQDKSVDLALDIADNYEKIGSDDFKDMSSEIAKMEEDALKKRNEINNMISAGNYPPQLIKLLKEELNVLDKSIGASKAKHEEMQQINNVSKEAQGVITKPFDMMKSAMESLPFGGLASQIVGLDKIQADFTEGTRKSMAAFIKSGGKNKLMLKNIEGQAKKSIEGLSKGFQTLNNFTGGMIGPIMLIVGAIMLAKKMMELFYGGTMETRKELGVTSAEAAKLQSTINTTAMEFGFLGVSAEDAKGMVTGIADNMGGVGEVTRETVSGMASLNANFGIAGEDAAKLMTTMQSVGSASKNAAMSQLESVGHLARQNGVAPAGIVSDMASDMEFFSEYAKDGGKNMAMAAIGAKKLGINMATVSKMAESLLSFEDSINAQMEAQMLTGRSINTDKARELALAGDMEGMQKEITSQIGDAADFEAMNVVQRKAMAAAFGVSVSELSKMVTNQDNLNKMTDSERKHRDYMAKILEYAGKAWAGFLSIGKAILPIVIGIGVAMLVAFWPITAAVAGITLLGAGFNWLNKQVPLLGTGLGVILGLITAFKVQAMLSGKALSGGMMGGIKNVASGLKEKLGGLGGGGKGGGLMDGLLGGDKTKTTKKKKQGNPFGFMEKMDPKKVLAGAAAMLIVSAALFVTAKALQEFASVSWGDMAKAGVALLALVLVLAAIGAIMMSGVGALAILAGAAAMLVIAASLLVLGIAIQAIGKGFDILAGGLTKIFPIMTQLVSLGASIMVLGAAFGALAIGLGAFAVAAMALMPALPVLMVLGGIALGAGLLLGGGGAGDEENAMEVEMKKTNEKLDKVITLLSDTGPIAENTKKGAKAGEGFIRSVIMA